MINLIPPSAKKSIVREYWLRVASVWLFILSAVGAIFAILLVPVYVLIKGQISVYAESAQVAINETKEYDLSSAELIRASKQARMILDLTDTIRLSRFITLIDEIEKSGVTIDSYILSQKDDIVTPITITGTALTRQALANFRETLLTHPDIKTAYLPISNLALDKNITFSVTITMK